MAQIKTPVGNAPLIPVMLLVGGGYLAWFGVHYWRQDIRWPSDPLKSLLTGKGIPASVPPPTVHSEFISAISSTGTADGGGAAAPSAVTGGGSAQQTLQQTAAQFGWTGSEWISLHALEMGEAGFNPHAKNPSSGAYGLAQALGHGNGAATQGTESNMYGGYGLSNAQAKAANSGDAAAQSLWMCNYIKATYGSPSAAWAKWQARSPHWY